MMELGIIQRLGSCILVSSERNPLPTRRLVSDHLSPALSLRHDEARWIIHRSLVEWRGLGPTENGLGGQESLLKYGYGVTG